MPNYAMLIDGPAQNTLLETDVTETIVQVMDGREVRFARYRRSPDAANVPRGEVPYRFVGYADTSAESEERKEVAKVTTIHRCSDGKMHPWSREECTRCGMETLL